MSISVAVSAGQSADPTPITIGRPEAKDGLALHKLVAACPPLDGNSTYCNLLQCTHFAATSVVARFHQGESEGGRSQELAGAITGYRLPEATSTLFVWQVAVHPEARGMGLAKSMLSELFKRCSPDGVTHLHTTITADNAASWALFESFAVSIGADISSSTLFDRDQHFGGKHPSELLVCIGPAGGQR